MKVYCKIGKEKKVLENKIIEALRQSQRCFLFTKEYFKKFKSIFWRGQLL